MDTDDRPTAAAEHTRRLLALGRLDDAERTARAGLAAAPHDADLLTALAAVLLTAGRRDDALAAADAAAGTAAHDERPHRIRALALSALDRHAEAAAAADGAAERAPHSARVAVDRAWVLQKAGRLAAAEAEARRAVALDPPAADAHVLLAGVLAERDDRAGARAAYAEALRLDPGHVAARHDLALLDAREHRPVRALAGLLDAGALDPAAPPVLATTARVVGLLLARLQKVLLAAVVGLGTLGWSIPAGNPSRAWAGAVLAVAAALIGWTVRRLPRGAVSVVPAALRADPFGWGTATAAGLGLGMFATVAVAGFPVAYASLAFVLGFGALALLYAVVVFTALGVRAAYRRARRRDRPPAPRP